MFFYAKSGFNIKAVNIFFYRRRCLDWHYCNDKYHVWYDISIIRYGTLLVICVKLSSMLKEQNILCIYLVNINMLILMYMKFDSYFVWY